MPIRQRTALCLIGKYNPLRYRGYVYDEETGLYYLQSRYYNAEVGRFINADDVEILLEDQNDFLQHNLFVYCWNEPVNMYDPDGYIAIEATAGIASVVFEIIVSLGITAVIIDSVRRIGKTDNRVVSSAVQKKIKKKTKKKTKKSGKEKAEDAPDWAKREKYDKTKTAEQNAKNVLDKKYGKGKWKKGPSSEFSQIKKWLQRSKGYK